MTVVRNFAPGQWSWETSGKPGGNGDFNIYVLDRDERKIAAVWGKRGEKEWTAALMASGPDLFAFALARAEGGDAEALAILTEIDAMAQAAADAA